MNNKTNRNLNNETVLITGASRGIGRSLAISMAKKGANIIAICKQNDKELIRLLEELEDLGVKTYGFVGDISNYQTVVNLYEEITLAVKSNRLINMPSIIINNAGVSHIGLIQDTDINDWQNVINTNLSAPFYIVKNFVSDMIKQRNGLIVNISSIWGLEGASMETAYSASKAGLEGLTRACALELEPSQVDVIGFRLGMIDTDMNKCYSKEDMEEITKHLKNNQMGKSSDVAESICSTIINNEFNTGDIINLEYGWIN